MAKGLIGCFPSKAKLLVRPLVKRCRGSQRTEVIQLVRLGFPNLLVEHNDRRVAGRDTQQVAVE
jgi:hypothetical protein